MDSSDEVNETHDHKDWMLFTSYILLASVSFRFVIEEIDALIGRGVDQQQLAALLEVRRTLAIYAPVYKYFQEGDQA